MAGRKRSAKPACPICGKAEEDSFKPFCSKRCADVDLGRWLGGTYRIETEEEPDFQEMAANDDRSDYPTEH